jgi:urease accessory protein
MDQSEIVMAGDQSEMDEAIVRRISPSENSAATAAPPMLQRTTGLLRLGFCRAEGCTGLSTLFQQGAAKARFPKVPIGLPPEAVIINTAGGLTGGDRFSVEIGLEAGAAATVTTQACERIYRSAAGAAAVETTLRLEGFRTA